MNKHYFISAALGLLLTAFSFGLAFSVGWVDAINWLEFFAVVTMYASAYLAVVEARWNYPVGIVTTFLYSILLFQWGMPAMGIFSLYMVFSLTYGWFRWGPDGNNTLKITKIKDAKGYLFYVCFGIFIALIMAGCFAVMTYIGYEANLLALDVLVASVSGVAQLMLDNKKIENWWVWKIVNVFSVVLYFTQGLYLAAIQYVFLLANTFYGSYKWKNSVNLERD